MEAVFNSTIRVPITTKTVATGVNIDADSLPVVSIYLNGSTTAMTYTGETVVNRATAGNYVVPIVVTAANGFAVGDNFEVWVTATITAVEYGPEPIKTYKVTSNGLTELATLAAALQADLDNGTDGLGALLTAINTRLATAGYTAPDNSGIAGIQTDLDNAVDGLGALKTIIEAITPSDATAANQVSILGYVDELETRLSATRAGLLDNLDAAISSRLATAGYTAPNNSGITGIQSDLDNATDGLGALLAAVEAIVPSDATAANQVSILAYVDELETRLTAVRAGLLDNLDAAVSTRAVAGDSMVASNMRGTDSAMLAASYVAPDNSGIAGIQTDLDNAVDGLGALKTLIEAIVPSDATAANQVSILAYVDELETRLSAVRAGLLDNLDAAISTRAVSGDSMVASNMRGTDSAMLAASYVVPDNSGIAGIQTDLDNAIDGLGAIKGAVDGIVAGGDATGANQLAILAYVDELETRLTATRAGLLDNLDAAISSRAVAGDSMVASNMRGTDDAMLAASYVAPDNSGIAGIQTDLDNATDGLGALLAAIGGIVAGGDATAENQATIIGYVDELESRLTSVRAGLLDYLDVPLSSRMDSVTYTAPPDASSIADAVWASASRTLTSFGTLVADTAAAVWASVTRTLTAGTRDAEIDAINAQTVQLQFGTSGVVADVDEEAITQSITDTLAEAIHMEATETLLDMTEVPEGLPRRFTAAALTQAIPHPSTQIVGAPTAGGTQYMYSITQEFTAPDPALGIQKVRVFRSAYANANEGMWAMILEEDYDQGADSITFTSEFAGYFAIAFVDVTGDQSAMSEPFSISGYSTDINLTFAMDDDSSKFLIGDIKFLTMNVTDVDGVIESFPSAKITVLDPEGAVIVDNVTAMVDMMDIKYRLDTTDFVAGSYKFYVTVYTDYEKIQSKKFTFKIKDL